MTYVWFGGHCGVCEHAFLDFWAIFGSTQRDCGGGIAPAISVLVSAIKYFEWPTRDLLAGVSYAWALLPLVIWLLVAYIRRHAASVKLEDATKPKLNYRGRFRAPDVELILTNVSSKTVCGIEPILRNYRRPDDTGITEVQRSLSRAPISMNPMVPTYFSIAELKNSEIVIVHANGQAQPLGRETVLKCGISGLDMRGEYVYFHLTVEGESIDIKLWAKKNGERRAGP